MFFFNSQIMSPMANAKFCSSRLLLLETPHVVYSNHCTGTRLTPLSVNFEAVRKDPSRAQTLASALTTLRSSPVPPAFGNLK